MTKEDFLNRIEAITASYGFDRYGDRFARAPAGYLLAQEIDFHWARSGFGHYNGSPQLSLWLKFGRGYRTAAPARSFSEKLAHFGMMLGVQQATLIDWYNSLGDEPDWFDHFNRVLGEVLLKLDPVMKDRHRLVSYLRNDPLSFRHEGLIARVAELPESPQGG